MRPALDDENTCLGVQLFKIRKGSRSGCSPIADSGRHLTAHLGTDIPRRKESRQIRPHLAISDNEPLRVQFETSRQETVLGLIAHKDEHSIHRKLCFLTGFDIFQMKPLQRVFSHQTGYHSIQHKFNLVRSGADLILIDLGGAEAFPPVDQIQLAGDPG